MKNFKKKVNNEQGFVLIASLMMLMVLMIIGIAATNTTNIELQISGNDKLNKQTFYQAEAAVNEAVQIIMENPADHKNSATWLLADGVVTVGPSGNEFTIIHTESTWNNSAPSALLANTEMISAYRGIAPGGSLGLGGSSPQLFAIYGRSQRSGALSIVKVSCRTHF